MHGWHLFALAGLFALGAMSCARYEPRPIDPAATANAFEQRRLDSADLHAFFERNLANGVAHWPLRNWNFEQLALAALHLHPSLETARAELAIARAGEITVGARPNPTLSAGPEYNFTPVDSLSPWIANVQFDLPIETAGKRRLRRERSAQTSVAAERRLSVAAWTVRRNVRSALLRLAVAREQQDALDEQLVLRQRAVASAEARFTAGALARADLEAERALAAELRRETAAARAEASEAHAQLAAAIGVTLAALPSISAIDATLPATTALDTAAARWRALTGRGDILATLADYAAAEKTLELEISKQYPDVHLKPGYQWDQGENKWALGVTVELPVLNQNQGPIAEARARRAAAAARVMALQASIIGELERALSAVRQAKALVEAAQASVAAQESRVLAARTAFENGAIELSDVLVAETQRAASEIHVVAARARLRQAVADVEDAVQFPLPDVSGEPCSK